MSDGRRQMSVIAKVCVRETFELKVCEKNENIKPKVAPPTHPFHSLIDKKGDCM